MSLVRSWLARWKAPRTPLHPQRRSRPKRRVLDLDSLEQRLLLARTNLLATGADAGGPSEVKVYDAATGTQRFDFLAYPTAFTGGVRVAVADVNGDDIPDIITGSGPGSLPEVKVFHGGTGFCTPHLAAIRDHT